MKRIFLLCTVIFAAAVCSFGFNARAEASGKILVAYFSYQGHTAKVAREIAAQTGGDLFEIKPATPYPGYAECLDMAKAEKNNNARPAIDGRVENMADYDVVFVGYPIWWYELPMIMQTFFDTYDLSGKTIIPFNTHEGSGDSGTYDQIKTEEPNATVLEGLPIRGGDIENSDSKDKVTEWLTGLGY